LFFTPLPTKRLCGVTFVGKIATEFFKRAEVSVIEIGLFFGSEDGNTEKIAYRIQKRFGSSHLNVHDIADVTQADFGQYSNIIFGIPTWDFGQLQSDWDEFWGDISAVNFTGKSVALFGLGDQFGYADYFLDAMGMLHDVVSASGAKIVGCWPTDGYEFNASKATILGEQKFVGLALDEDQQEHFSADRLNRWCQQIHHELGLTSPLLNFQDS
jgi:flavodoxin I